MEELACFEDIGALKKVLPIFLEKYDLFEEFKEVFKEHTLKKKTMYTETKMKLLRVRIL